MTKKELIQLCENAVVPCEDWRDRDSASAQNNIYEIFIRLMADIPYTYSIEGDTTIWIDFTKPTEEMIKNIKKQHLCVDTVSDYRERVSDDPNDEMFEPGYPPSSEKYSGYMPTQKRLNDKIDEDWY